MMTKKKAKKMTKTSTNDGKDTRKLRSGHKVGLHGMVQVGKGEPNLSKSSNKISAKVALLTA